MKTKLMVAAMLVAGLVGSTKVICANRFVVVDDNEKPRTMLARPVLIIPIHGWIEHDVTARYFRAALGVRHSRAVRPSITTVVIDLDTPGGDAVTMDEIIKLINGAAGNVEFYAYVSGDKYGGAFSAGAYIAMACRHILMKPGTSIGASMVVEHSRGITDKAAPKFQATYAAEARALAEKNGHPPAVAEAMTLTDMTLYAIPTQKGFRFYNDTEYARLKPAEKAKAQVVKRRGKILALTARECERYGIAKVVNQQDVASVLGITDHAERGRFMRNWRLAVRRTSNARLQFTKVQKLLDQVGQQRTVIAEYLNRIELELNRDHFTTVAKMFDTLAANCVAFQTHATKYPSFSKSVQATSALRKRAVATSQRIRNIVAKDQYHGVTSYRASDETLLRQQIEEARVEEERELARSRDEQLAWRLSGSDPAKAPPSRLYSPGAQARERRARAEMSLYSRQRAREEIAEQRTRYLTLYKSLLREFGRFP